MQSELLTSVIRVAPFAGVLGVIGLRVKFGKLQPADLSWREPRSWWSAAGWWLLFVVFAVSLELLLYSRGDLQIGGFHHHGLPAVLRIVGMVLLAPVAEELLFRGLFLNWLTKRLSNAHLAIVAQALVFVALHGFAYQGGFVATIGIVQAFIDAMLFAYALRYTGSIFTPIAMHVTGNSIAVLEMLA